MAAKSKDSTLANMYTARNIGYGSANMFSTLRSQMNSNYQQFFLNSVVMLPAVMAANIATISSTVSLLVSIFLGFIMQKSNPKMGRFRFWMLVGGSMSAICGIMMFTPLNANALPSAFVYIWYLIAIVGGVGYSIFYTPYTGCISLISTDVNDRAAMSGVRQQMNSMGKLAWSFFSVSLIAVMVSLTGSQGWGYTVFSVFVSGLFMCGVLIVVKQVKGLEKPDEKDANGKSESISVITMIKLALNRPMLCLCVGSLGKSVCYAIVYGVMAYYYTYVIGDTAGMTWYLSASTVIQMLGGVAAPFISKKISPKWTCVLGYVFYAAALVLSFVFGKNGVAFTALMSIGIFGYSLEHSTVPVMSANVADWSYYTTGINARAFLYQVTGIVANLSNVIKSACLGYGLAYFGFDAAAITDRAILGIRLITAFVPTFFLVTGIIAYALFPLTNERMAQVKAEFEAKHAQG